MKSISLWSPIVNRMLVETKHIVCRRFTVVYITEQGCRRNVRKIHTSQNVATVWRYINKRILMLVDVSHVTCRQARSFNNFTGCQVPKTWCNVILVRSSNLVILMTAIETSEHAHAILTVRSNGRNRSAAPARKHIHQNPFLLSKLTLLERSLLPISRKSGNTSDNDLTVVCNVINFASRTLKIRRKNIE